MLSDGEKRALFDAGGMTAVDKGAGGTDPWGRPVGVRKGGFAYESAVANGWTQYPLGQAAPLPTTVSGYDPAGYMSKRQ